MDVNVSLGLKLFKQEEDSVSVIRIIKMNKLDDNYGFLIKDCNTGEEKKVDETFFKDYTPLEPDGVFTVSIANIDEYNEVKDVIITTNRYLDTKLKIAPFAICRQNISDLFAELFCQSEENTVVGMSVNRNNCPVGFDMKIMLMATSIDYHQFINIYRMDCIDDILEMVNTDKFDEVLTNSYTEHCKASNPQALLLDTDAGWCKTLKLLLQTNNFMADINEMFNIFEIDFDISEYFETRKKGEIKYNVLRDDVRYWLSSLYKCNIAEANVIEFDHDIDLADFKNSRYILIRNKDKKMYLVVYTVEGEYLESDLKEKEKEYDFSTKFKIDFYNKYNRINTDNNT